MYINTKFLFVIYSIIQIPIFIAFWVYYSTNKNFRCSCKKFKQTFPLAKTSAALISYNLSILILSTLKFIKKYIFVPIVFKYLHYTSLFYLYSWSVIHSIAHYINFQKLNNPPYFSWGVGFTGHVLLLLLLLFFIFSLPIVRQQFFHKFIVFHHIFFISFITFLYLHQSFCFIKTDTLQCPLPFSWIWFTLPFLLYIIENIYKYIFCSVKLYNYIEHSHNIIELQLQYNQSTLLSSNISGRTIWLCCTNISMFEWHPFAITSVNYSSNTFSIIIKNRGNWTNKLVNQLTYTYSPNLLLYGPFINISKRFLTNLQHEHSIIITSGIGITSFISTFYTLLYTPIYSTLHIIVITKHPSDISWAFEIFHSLLRYKQNNISLHFYFTKMLNPNSIQFPFHYSLGRPNLEHELIKPSLIHVFNNNKKILIYHSGTNAISRKLYKLTQKYPYYTFYNLH